MAVEPVEVSLAEDLERRLQELEEECIQLLDMRSRLRRMSPGEERETLEAELYVHLTQLESSAIETRNTWDEYDDSFPEGAQNAPGGA